MLTRRTVILAGAESTYGTDPALTGAANGILAYDVDLDIKGEVLKREILRDSLSPVASVIGMKEVALNFKTELKGVGAGSTPELDALLTGCGFGSASHSGTANVIYSLQSAESTIRSISLWIYKDGNKHKILGSRGTVKFNLEAGKYAVAEWELSGLYAPVQADTLPDITGLSQNKPPICYAAAFQIAGFAPVCSKAMIDLGNEVVRRDDLNAAYGVNSFRISNRAPKLEFSADAIVEASNPFWGDWSGDVVDTFGITVGSVAGNKVAFTGYFKYETNKYGDQDGVSIYDCKAILCSSDINTSNDELVVTFS